MDLRERIEMLTEAQEKLLEARELIKEAVEDTKCERNTKAYLIDQLEVLTTSEHCWLNDDLNIDKVIENLKEEFTEEVES